MCIGANAFFSKRNFAVNTDPLTQEISRKKLLVTFKHLKPDRNYREPYLDEDEVRKERQRGKRKATVAMYSLSFYNFMCHALMFSFLCYVYVYHHSFIPTKIINIYIFRFSNFPLHFNI